MPKDKHMASGASDRWAKFKTDDPNQVRNLVKEALESEKRLLLNNKNEGSFRIVTDLGREIGTKGQTKVRVVFKEDGTIFTAFPVKDL